jgi:hypothetical protein
MKSVSENFFLDIIHNIFNLRDIEAVICILVPLQRVDDINLLSKY